MRFMPRQATTSINLVGYALNDNAIDGVVTPLTIDAAWSDHYVAWAQNSQGQAWLSLFNRLCSILIRINPCWEVLSHCAFYLRYHPNNYQPSECHSAGLGLAIGLFNIVRLLNGSTEVRNVTGTGIVRLDGTVERGQHEAIKKQAISQTSGETCLTAVELNHLGQLQSVLMPRQF